MRKITFMLVIFIIFLIGCNNENIKLNYEGKSLNWKVSYKIDGNKKSHESYYTFKYIGTDNNYETEVKYSIDGPKEGETGKFTINNTNEYTGKMKITGGIPSISDRDIKVKVVWNDKTELLTLKRVK